MTSMFETLKTAARKRAQYNCTLAELRGMTLDTALDLDIHVGDAERIARRAVYGA